MKINLVENITALIEGYKQTTETLNAEIKAAIDRWQAVAVKHSLNTFAFINSITEEINAAKATAQKTDIVLNQKLKELVYNAKNKLLPVENNKPADYAQRVNNALQFLSFQLDELDDNGAYLILKDFVNDYNQMRLFRSMIEKHVDMVDAAGVAVFPLTFGKLMKAENLLNMFSEIEPIAENLFIFPTQEGGRYIVDDVSQALITESYEEMAGEEEILKIAQAIEEITADIPAPIV